jgi:hypothetical protein
MTSAISGRNIHQQQRTNLAPRTDRLGGGGASGSDASLLMAGGNTLMIELIYRDGEVMNFPVSVNYMHPHTRTPLSCNHSQGGHVTDIDVNALTVSNSHIMIRCLGLFRTSLEFF